MSVRHVVLAVALLTGCAVVRPVPLGSGGGPPDAPPSHAGLDRVLQRTVGDDGTVDYPAVVRDHDELEVYYAGLAAVSPASHPMRFRTADERLAYWINAYNAAVILAVVRRYPMTSVRDVFPPLAGFFVLQRFELGGKLVNLYALENDIIRAEFDDPRVHFALNCGSRGCPRLPRRAFTGEGLQAELDREARRFVAERRNVDVDSAARVVRLSSIFGWYEGDFTGWMRRHRPDEAATVLGYVTLYADDVQRVALAGCTDCRVELVPYDWGLNERVHDR